MTRRREATLNDRVGDVHVRALAGPPPGDAAGALREGEGLLAANGTRRNVPCPRDARVARDVAQMREQIDHADIEKRRRKHSVLSSLLGTLLLGFRRLVRPHSYALPGMSMYVCLYACSSRYRSDHERLRRPLAEWPVSPSRIHPPWTCLAARTVPGLGRGGGLADAPALFARQERFRTSGYRVPTASSKRRPWRLGPVEHPSSGPA